MAELILHATTVGVAGCACMIIGRAGAGKSSLAFGMMALGAGLVADDRTALNVMDGKLIASCPPAIQGMIEARGIGILASPMIAPCPVALIVDLDQVETTRLPPHRQSVIAGVAVPLVHGQATPHFPAILLHYLRHGRASDDSTGQTRE